MNIEGKTKIIETVADPNLVRIVTKDSLTANDAAIQADLPVAEDKTAQTCSVFHLLKNNNIPVAYITRNSPISFIAEKCDMIPIECVIRRRPFGSYFKRHPEMEHGKQKIFDPLLTEFFHKHAIVGNEMMSEDKARDLYLRNGEWIETVYTDPLIEPQENSWLLYPPKQPRYRYRPEGMAPFSPTLPLMSIRPEVDPVTLEYIRSSLMVPCFEILEKAWKKFDVELIDMKIEIGINQNKELVIADVIDNDSWRIWPNGDPKKQLDKQSFRDGEKLTEVQKKYRIVTEYTKNF
jgi:phosphoribosylaminoimidazole-succinocarboxamide synthase